MQYSVRSRRRLRPTTGEVARATGTPASVPAPPAVLAEGSGAHSMPRPPLPRMLVERVSARAKLSGRDR